jgi:hypothetical protein
MNKCAHRQAGNTCKSSANSCAHDLLEMTLERVMNGSVSRVALSREIPLWLTMSAHVD